MRRRHRSTLLAALLALAVPAAALSAVAAPAAADPAGARAEAPLRYVALGDSFSAASGVLPPDLTAPALCQRSTRNYPHVIARRTGARLTDVTCGGAETGDYFAAQYPDAPRQLDALDERTQLVTMTIGGNDGGVFVGAIARCGALGAASLGQGSPCRDTFGSELVDQVRSETYPALVRTLRATHRAAPRARVAILGYPQLLPRRVGCYPQMPIARGDVPYLRNLQAVLNAGVRRAARLTGSTYVAIPAASEGHDACQAPGVRWIEPVVGGTNPVVVHPNAFGEARMATLTMQRLGLRRG
ncbi:SGNH/GDSL hydrolase family protein [Nocardioides lentus]|uniref:SGNH/GDSL hydrolase family protein n=1 Tax=Nocardioides lentus TaxID=338077 RepID=A0ABP5AAL0_9ACTN